MHEVMNPDQIANHLATNEQVSKALYETDKFVDWFIATHVTYTQANTAFEELCEKCKIKQNGK